MFDFDASKLVLIGIVALIFIGPKELPRVLRQVGQMVGKMRRMAAEFQGQFMDAMKEADLENLRLDLAKVQDAAKFNVDFNPVAEIKNSISGAISPPQTSPASPDADFHLPPAPELPQPAIPAVAAPDAAPPFETVAEPVSVRKLRIRLKPAEEGSPGRRIPISRPRVRKIGEKSDAPQDLEA